MKTTVAVVQMNFNELPVGTENHRIAKWNSYFKTLLDKENYKPPQGDAKSLIFPIVGILRC